MVYDSNSGNHNTDMNRCLKNNCQLNVTRRSVFYLFNFWLTVLRNTFKKIVKKMHRTIAATPRKLIIYKLYLSFFTTSQITQE
ncbi:hypothetical protein VC36_18170 [Pseudomonas marginalis]|nr:hypothetical protein VC37_22370 [Pseudomonas marginalis]KJZ57303.1 hypothetical protein VC36_18170 [Pseudomonas marginalis]